MIRRYVVEQIPNRMRFPGYGTVAGYWVVRDLLTGHVESEHPTEHAARVSLPGSRLQRRG